MQLKNLFSLCLLGAVVTAGRTGKQTGSARFDDLWRSPLNWDSALNQYDYLYWAGFNVASERFTGNRVFGVKPKSSPNVAYGQSIDENGGGPALVVGPKTKSFDLKSFYYACIDVTREPVPTATNCTMTVTGNRGTEQVVKQGFSYEADLRLADQLAETMAFVELTGFTDLTSVGFRYTADDPNSPASFIGDNFKYIARMRKDPQPATRR